MIAYFFPPLGGVGAQRATKFARYLPEWGWQPVVLSVKNSPYPAYDPDLLAQVPAQVPIFRARTLEPEHLYPLYLRLTRHRRQRSHLPSNVNMPQYAAGTSWAARLLSWLFIPDGQIGWYYAAVKMGKQAIRETKPAVIFSTSAPYTAHLVAKTLAQWAGLPWVMDFRDAWVENIFHQLPTHFHRRQHSRMERGCVDQADRVICATAVMTEEMQARYSGQPAQKFVTITNGYDRSDYAPGSESMADQFLIRYVGSLYGRQSPLPFLKGLALALQQQPALGRHLQVEFIGMMDQANRQDWESCVQAHALTPWVSSRPFVPHQQAIHLMQTSQVQLLILAQGEQSKGVLTGKIFEYLGAQRPVLSIAPPGLAADLIRETQAGLVADPSDIEGIANAISEFFMWFQQGKLKHWISKNIYAYERRHLTEQLAQILSTVTTKQQ